MPMATSPLWTWLRSGAMAIAALVLAFTPGIHSLVVIALFAGAVTQPLMLWASDGRDISSGMALSDIVLACTVAAAEPVLFPAAALWIGTLITWQAVTSPVRIAVPISIAAGSALAISGTVADIDRWWTVTIAQAMLTGAYFVFGFGLRAEVFENENDLLATVSVGGAFVHRSTIDAGTATQVHGDVEGVTGYTAETWIGLDHRTIVHPDDLDTFWLDIAEAEPDTMIDRVGRVRRADGRWIWLRDVSRVTRDRRGRLVLRGLTLDVTDAQERHADEMRQARVDPMTGLPNRLALNEEIEARIHRDTDFAMMLVDLNRFKEVNDTLGHEAGDQLLVVLGERLRAAIGPDDHLARMGGDEFSILVEGANSWADVEELEAAIAGACSEPIDIRGVSLAVSASTGIAFARTDTDRATLLRHADIAMYAAKRGAQSYRVFDATLEHTSTLRLSLTGALPNALRAGEIELFFQPKFDLRNRELVGAEGLVRWRHPEFGLLTPDAFLDVALLSESAADIVRTTVDQAVRMIRRTIDHGRPLPIAVNLAIASIRDLDFSSTLFDTLERHDVPAELLTIEITENDIDHPSDDVVGMLNSISTGGVTISIDDFGTGHSSLERLRTLHADEVKIDRMFIKSIADEGRDRKIVQTIIDLADRFDIDVVAEGVETERQAELLRSMGCATAQGYLFEAAMEPERFEHLVTGPVERDDSDSGPRLRRVV